jgi:hypothetical protein
MSLQTQYSGCQNVLTNPVLRMPECPYKPSTEAARMSLQTQYSGCQNVLTNPVLRLSECPYKPSTEAARMSLQTQYWSCQNVLTNPVLKLRNWNPKTVTGFISLIVVSLCCDDGRDAAIVTTERIRIKSGHRPQRGTRYQDELVGCKINLTQLKWLWTNQDTE